MCALGPGQRSCQRLSVHRLVFTSEDGQPARLCGFQVRFLVDVLVGGFFSELNVLVFAEGLAGVGALGRQEVNDACLVSLMSGN